ncbi:calcium-binding EF-hand family protein [Artemisia annua]|uniref:Calcium-binding EF-hand family protein n=1 Tax=Artemisia annua TaxID=35608 RepID=A0A2U1MLQ8_ARTAN|nr:calcium-binding EF-hand family protein [Artemisia annua]
MRALVIVWLRRLMCLCDTTVNTVLSEFTHGKDRKVSKTEFKKVLSDFLIGMAAGLKRDPIVILRIDGEDLLEFVDSPAFEPEMMSILSEIDIPGGSLTDYINKAFEKLTVDKGMPPVLDSWVVKSSKFKFPYSSLHKISTY